MAKVSAVILADDKAERVDELIGSLMFQTEEDVEIICTVKPESRIVPLLQNYTIFDNRIKLVYHEPEQHPFVTALQNATAPYVLFLHNSSFVNTPCIEKVLQLAATSDDVDFVYTPIVYKNVLSNQFYSPSMLTPADFSPNSFEGTFTSNEMSGSFLQKADNKICGKLIRTDLLRQIISDPSVPIDEGVLFYKCLRSSRKIVYTMAQMIFEWENPDPYMPSFLDVKDESLKISVIIPVYNVNPRYLRCCLDSLALQTYKNLEIICVDDSSTDGSLQILQEYATKDARFKVITQPNQGVSGARNTGLKAVTGDYIAFMDHDDSISLALYQKFVAVVQHEEKQIDLFQHNGLKFSKTDSNLSMMKFLFDILDWGHFYEGHYKDFREYCNLSQGTIWNKIYRAEWLLGKNITFPVGMLFEDNAFSVATYLSAKNIYITEAYLHFYRELQESQIHNLNEKVFDTFKLTDILVKNLKQEKYFEQSKPFLFECLTGTYWGLFKLCPPERQEEFLFKARKYLRSFPPIPENLMRQKNLPSMYNDIMNLNAEEMRKKLEVECTIC